MRKSISLSFSRCGTFIRDFSPGLFGFGTAKSIWPIERWIGQCQSNEHSEEFDLFVLECWIMKKCSKRRVFGNDTRNPFENEVDCVMKSKREEIVNHDKRPTSFLEHMRSITMTWNGRSNSWCERIEWIHGLGIDMFFALFSSSLPLCCSVLSF